MKSKRIVAIITSLLLLSIPTLASAAPTSSTVINAKAIVTVNPSLININTIQYTVVKGDILWNLSKTFNTSIDSIMKLNNLKSSMIFIGQNLTIQDNRTISINYKVLPGDNLWNIAKKYNTTEDSILKSNMLTNDELMPNEILTVPVNSTNIVKPFGITMYKPRKNNNFGDLYTWENGRRLFTVGTHATLRDLATGISFNIKYYGGSNHADIVSLTKSDTANIEKVFTSWSWENRRPMILNFKQGETSYQLAVSMTGMPHSTTDIYDNGINGHFDLYFLNSTTHNTNELSVLHQKNVLIANGQ